MRFQLFLIFSSGAQKWQGLDALIKTLPATGTMVEDLYTIDQQPRRPPQAIFQKEDRHRPWGDKVLDAELWIPHYCTGRFCSKTSAH